MNHCTAGRTKPFNPSTTIKISLKQPGFVTLKIYNMLGEEVATLVNTEEDAGEYTVEWDAGSLPSGPYIDRLQSGGFVESRKLLLLK